MEASPILNGASRPTGGWRVMIVEDNHEVAVVHKQIVDSLPALQTVHIAHDGRQAFAALAVAQPQLVILDLSMTGGDGLTFLKRLRADANPIDVIVVSASRSGTTIRQAMQAGIVDYLVKPFSPRRLRQTLLSFVRRQETLGLAREVSQDELDAFQAAALPRPADLPRGLKPTTLRDVAQILAVSRDALTATEVAQQIGIARVTARRYLEHLCLVGIADVSPEMSGRGRPRNRYRARGAGR